MHLQDDPTIGEFAVALLRYASPDSIEAGEPLCGVLSIHMAHGLFTWGVEPDLEDARETRMAHRPLDGHLLWQVINKVWDGRTSMEDALKDAGLSRSSALQVYKALG